MLILTPPNGLFFFYILNVSTTKKRWVKLYMCNKTNGNGAFQRFLSSLEVLFKQFSF